MTGGGDCPGLNAVIRAVTKTAKVTYGDEVVGFLEGWKGVMDRNFIDLTNYDTSGLIGMGGTMLGTSRSNPGLYDGGLAKAKESLDEMGLHALIVIGGDGTLRAAHELQKLGGDVIGVPKTIDNDIADTEYTFGFNTAVQIATDLIDRLRTTAESHNRVMVVEVMGRHVGHVATHAGIAGGAEVILIPEEPFDIDEVCDRLRRRHSHGKFSSIVVVAEGAMPKPGTIEVVEPELDMWGNPKLGGIGDMVGRAIEQRTGFESRVTVLGHVQRGGTPTAYDRVLCTRYGVAAVEAIHDRDFANMVSLTADDIIRVPLADVVDHEKPVSARLYDVASKFFA